MTALERYNAAYCIAGFSTRLSELFKLDQADDDGFQAFVPPPRRATP